MYEHADRLLRQRLSGQNRTSDGDPAWQDVPYNPLSSLCKRFFSRFFGGERESGLVVRGRQPVVRCHPGYGKKYSGVLTHSRAGIDPTDCNPWALFDEGVEGMDVRGFVVLPDAVADRWTFPMKA